MQLPSHSLPGSSIAQRPLSNPSSLPARAYKSSSPTRPCLLLLLLLLPPPPPPPPCPHRCPPCSRTTAPTPQPQTPACPTRPHTSPELQEPEPECLPSSARWPSRATTPSRARRTKMSLKPSADLP